MAGQAPIRKEKPAVSRLKERRLITKRIVTRPGTPEQTRRLLKVSKERAKQLEELAEEIVAAG